MTAHPMAAEARPTTPRLAMAAVVLAVADSLATWWWLHTGVAVEVGVLALGWPAVGAVWLA